MKRQEKNLEQIISEIKNRNNFDYSQNEGSLVNEKQEIQELKVFWRDYDLSNPSDVLDGIQNIIDVVGVIPAFGDALDAINAVVYALRGKYIDAVLSVVAIIPGVGSVIALPFKAALKALPINQSRKIAKLIVEGRGKEAAEKFAKFADDNEAVGAFFKKAGKYAGEVVDVFGSPFSNIALKLLKRITKLIPGKADDKLVFEILVPAVQKLFKGIAEFFGVVAEKAAKEGATKSDGIIKMIPKKAMMSKIITSRGRLVAPRGLKLVTSKRLFFLMQDRFMYDLFKKGGISSLPKPVIKELNAAANKSLAERGVKVTKEAVEREFSNLLILNKPELFEKFIDGYKITAQDFSKILGREYNKESAGRLRRVFKTIAKVSARGVMRIYRPDELERAEKEMQDILKGTDKAIDKATQDEKKGETKKGDKGNKPSVDPMEIW